MSVSDIWVAKFVPYLKCPKQSKPLLTKVQPVKDLSRSLFASALLQLQQRRQISPKKRNDWFKLNETFVSGTYFVVSSFFFSGNFGTFSLDNLNKFIGFFVLDG